MTDTPTHEETPESGLSGTLCPASVVTPEETRGEADVTRDLCAGLEEYAEMCKAEKTNGGMLELLIIMLRHMKPHVKSVSLRSSKKVRIKLSDDSLPNR